MKFLVAQIRPSSCCARSQPRPSITHPHSPTPAHSAMEFLVALLEKLGTDRAIALPAAASEAYYATLQRYHGWIVTGVFTAAMKLAPSRWGGRREGGSEYHGSLWPLCSRRQ